jgi:hypothetical protein
MTNQNWKVQRRLKSVDKPTKKGKEEGMPNQPRKVLRGQRRNVKPNLKGPIE